MATTDLQSTLRSALTKIEQLKARLAQHEGRATEPIAVVGLGCRFPGGSDTPEAFWRLLADGKDAVTEVPAHRFSARLRGSYPRWAAVVDDPERFDPGFFGVSPREASSMDPQHRLLLEVTYEAFERAGIPVRSLRGSSTAVFMGVSTLDYQQRVFAGDPEELDAFATTGNLASIAAGRISYVFGFQGPCATVDTACSSSLVALHMACQSLRQAECDVAVAGGVNLILSPLTMMGLSRTQALSPDGRCKTFDASANGYVRGEGCGVVVLKRLSDALRDGDPIWACVRGSWVNHDGQSAGLTAPNVQAQEKLLREALVRARVSPSDIGYIEAHGTGTPLGDPIEVDALRAVLGAPRSDGGRCVLGSVKANIGHLEAAAGIAGFVKAVLALKNEQIPRHLHFTRLNPMISLEGTPFMIPTEAQPWPRGERPRLAGVSSFGFSGTNAHVIVEEAPASAPREAKAERPVHVIAWSGRSAWSQRRRAEQITEYLAANPTVLVADVAHTLGACRDHFEKRAAAVCASTSQLLEGIQQWLKGEGTAHVMTGPEEGVSRAPRVAMVFTGQGSQHAGMGRALYEKHPVFRASMERCAALFDKHLSRPLLSVMYPPEGEGSPLDETTYTQPALFALEWSLFELWRSWGIEPVAVLGHSIGEVVAACAAGVLTLEDAVTLVVERSGRMGRLPAGGAMASVGGASERIEAIL
ncbi:MAG: type I polyketide synthase, partial [Polyangiaceae bacterium]|nr:type I polyketide synthase [Polyangiaceae bacterium]